MREIKLEVIKLMDKLKMDNNYEIVNWRLRRKECVEFAVDYPKGKEV